MIIPQYNNKIMTILMMIHAHIDDKNQNKTKLDDTEVTEVMAAVMFKKYI